MYAAMQDAPLGDDVLGEDPTVLELQRLAAEMTGKQAALFVPSGTMGNQIAIAVHCRRGDAILVEEEAHTLVYEAGGSAVIGGVVSWTLPSDSGGPDPEAVERRILVEDLHHPGTTLLCLENTHNRKGGTVIPLDRMVRYHQIAGAHGLRIHLDGARVFNAAAALHVPVGEITQHVDSVTFCLSKGLCAPIGSVLCGCEEFIHQAHRWRKRLGAGMRQVGVIAACGVVALRTMVDRLYEDHARARRLAEGISGLTGLEVEPAEPRTNIVMLRTHRPAVEWMDALAEHGVLCFDIDPHRLRLVTHHDVHDVHVEQTLTAFAALAERLG
jgi:threonine aldolase